MSNLLIIAIAALLGALWSGEFGAATGALLSWLALRSFRLERRIEELAREVREWRASAALRDTTYPTQQAETAPAQATAPTLPSVSDEVAWSAPAPLPENTMPAPQVLPQAAVAERPIPAPEPEWEPAREATAERYSTPPELPGDLLASARDWLLGGNTIIKLGIGILFVGLAFLAKYAVEHATLPIELRLAGIAGAALVLLGFGWRLRHDRPGYAQILQGGSVAVLYLTLFAAFRFYGVLAVGPVFAMMVVVAALAAGLAILQNARALASIGALGGFATPLLISTGSGDIVALFAYYLVLDLGIAAVAWHKTWRELSLIGFVATYLVASAWGVLRYRPEDYLVGQIFLIAFFLVFMAIMLLPLRDMKNKPGDIVRAAWLEGSLLFGLPTVTFVLQYGLVRDQEYGAAFSALALAAFYILMAAWTRGKARLAVAFEASLAIGTVFLTLVFPFALEARDTVGAWALEGAGLIWLGFRQERRLGRLFGYLLLFLSGLAWYHAADHHLPPTQWLNGLLINGLMLSAAALAGAYFVWRNTDDDGAPDLFGLAERHLEPSLIVWALVWLAVNAWLHIEALVNADARVAALLAAASIVGLFFIALAMRLDWRYAGMATALLAPLMALAVPAVAVAWDSPFDHGGVWAWPLAFATHLASLRWTARHWPVTLKLAEHTLGILILAVLGAQQGLHVTGRWGDAASAWPWLGWLAAPAFILLFLLSPYSERIWPFRAEQRAYRGYAGAILSLGLVFWSLFANVISNGSAQPLPYLPVLNPLDLGIGVALAAVWFCRCNEGENNATGVMPLMPILLGASVFVWMNAILIRSFHHYGGIAFEFNAWVDSLAVQTGLALLWTSTALGLMWLSARLTWRTPWLLGAVLLAAVILKLILVDLNGTGTVTRIISFIGVGVLMLVIGYVAPLPKERQDEAT